MALIRFFALAFALHFGTAAAQDNPVLATVNGEPIHQQELEQYRAQRGDSAGQLERKQLVDELVSRELIYQDALAKDLDERPDVIQELEQIRVQVLVGTAVRETIASNPVTEKELRAEYDRIKSQMGTHEYKARHILVKTQDEAKSLIAQLDKGADFAELARKHSTDPAGPNGGDLGWFAAEQMVPPFATAVRNLKTGSYTKQPVQTQFGWHVILLEDQRATQPPPFEQVKEQLGAAVQQRRVGEYIESLRKRAKVEIK